MTACDILIIGGGPSGSSLAWGLRDSGLDVCIMDKKTFPRDKVCAGWVTPAVIRTLDLDIDDYRRQHTFQPIHGFRVGRMGGGETTVDYNGAPASYGIRRCEFDHYLLQRTGVRMLLGEPFKKMERDNGCWVVNDEIEARLVVGAGGHFCPVARHLGARPGRTESTVTAQEVEFRMTPEQAARCSVRNDVPELFFCEDLQGYGWVFRKGEYVNIGLGRENTENLSDHVADFCRFLRQRGKIPETIEQKFNGHAYLLYDHARRKILDEGVLLIGDAAGLAYTQSGEGIRPAVESGLLAAGVIKAAGGNYAVEQIQPYLDQIVQRFGKRPRPPGLVDRLPAGMKKLLARGLLRSGWFVRNVVIEQWFLHT